MPLMLAHNATQTATVRCVTQIAEVAELRADVVERPADEPGHASPPRLRRPTANLAAR